MSVDSLIGKFATTTGPGKYPNIQRSDVLKGLRERTKDPSTIDQGVASLCGPAAFFYCLLQDKPEIYVQYVIDLYDTGSAKVGSLNVRPGKDCLNCSPKGIPPIDWIALASLRDSENLVFDYQDSSDKFAGITMPGTLAAWFEAVGYTQVRNETNVFFLKGKDEVGAASILSAQNRRVCLFINMDMLESDQPSHSITTTPNHWVVLNACTGVEKGGLSCLIWTWADMKRVPESGTWTVDQFCYNFFGYVAGICPHL